MRSRSSWDEYIEENENASSICEKMIILEQFGGKGEYAKFAETTLEDILERRSDLKDVEKMLLE